VPPGGTLLGPRHRVGRVRIVGIIHATAIDVTIQIFVISTMLSLGLQVPPERIVRGVRDWRTITTGSFLNLVVIPALGRSRRQLG